MNIVTKRIMKKSAALALSMVIALTTLIGISTADVFAATGDPISVTLTLDTRTIDQTDGVLKDKAGNLLGGPKVTYAVSATEGETVYDVLKRTADKNNFALIQGPDYGTGDYFISDIAAIGEKTFVGERTSDNQSYVGNEMSVAQASYYFLLRSMGGSDTLLSGWTYQINHDLYPTKAMNKWELYDGDAIDLRYTVTGSYDITAENFPSAPPYDNLDLDFLDVYDQLLAISNPNEDQEFMLYVIGEEMASAETEQGNDKGYTSVWYTRNYFSGPEGYTQMVRDLL